MKKKLKLNKINDASKNYLNNENVVETKTSLVQRIRSIFKHPFKFSVIDLAISGLLIALFTIVSSILKLTGLSNFTSAEIVFYILFGILLGPFKGALLALIADTLSLLILGNIGTWYYLYAIWPPIIAFISAWYFALFKSSKIFKIILPIIVIIASATIMTFVFAKYVTRTETGHIAIGVKMSKSNIAYWESIPWIMVVLGLSFYLLAMLIAIIFVVISYVKGKNEKLLDYLLILGLITLIISIYKWIFGPIIFVKYLSYINKKTYILKERYLLYFVPIVIKSMFNIPFYTLILGSLYSIINYVLEKHINNRNKVSY
ncbi:ECF transporter S component [Mycoplasmopsis felifaucium]|uniref:ECF transporter S component n=1 Tax=Mycoplasmopsis felifaucium TaxID=35768 RepID=UPI000569B5BF|nr:ECF transporter S component [Mycoplasmopsis felifaucium]